MEFLNDYQYKMNKSILILVSVLLFFPGLNAQKPDSDNYHVHRNQMHHSLSKFENEKTGRVVFLGGSITYGGGWRDSVCGFLQQKFPETDFDFINAGIPSMGSTPGAFRFKRDVLKNGMVDLLFVEAAVNDDTNRTPPEEIVRGMEGIVRHAKRANPKCDVVIMHFVDPGKMENYRNGKVPEVIELHEKVAEHYHVSTINLAKEVTERIDAGEFSWEEDFKDLHPSPFGQGIYFRSMRQFFENEIKKQSPNLPELVSYPVYPLDFGSYSNGVLVEPNPPKSIKGWVHVENWFPAEGVSTRANYVNVPMLVGEFPGKIIKFKFEGNAVGIAVAAGPDAGIIEYSIDNSEWKTQDLFTTWSKNLYLPWYITLGSRLKTGKHILQIRLTENKNVESTGKKSIIRYFYFNDAELQYE